MLNLPLDKLQPLIKFLSRYGAILVILAVGGVYAFLISTSGKLAVVEPSETQIDEKYQAADRPEIDKVITNKLNELKDSNVQFQALIDKGRDNPFQE